MSNSFENLDAKSKNLALGIKKIIEEIERTNGEIDVQIQMNNGIIEESQKNIEQLEKDNAGLVNLKTNNKALILKIQKILANED